MKRVARRSEERLENTERRAKQVLEGMDGNMQRLSDVSLKVVDSLVQYMGRISGPQGSDSQLPRGEEESAPEEEDAKKEGRGSGRLLSKERSAPGSLLGGGRIPGKGSNAGASGVLHQPPQFMAPFNMSEFKDFETLK